MSAPQTSPLHANTNNDGAGMQSTKQNLPLQIAGAGAAQKPSHTSMQQKKVSSKPIINWLQHKLTGAKRTENDRLAQHLKQRKPSPASRKTRPISPNGDDEVRRQSYGPEDGLDQLSSVDRDSSAADNALAAVRARPVTVPPSPSPSRDSSSFLSDPRTSRSMAASSSPLPGSSSSSQPPSIRNPDDAQINAHPRNNRPVDSSLLQQFTTFPEPATQVDPRDENTADSHVKRDPSMLRLTGKHPFNSEAPLKALEQAGFVTPNQLHFVRNHGPVPKLSWDDHRLEITGLVNRPVILTMQDILSLPPITLPVTLVCAGNRRKEQNVIKQSIGFHWGAAGLSTACWTGVYLRDVINHFAGGLQDDCSFLCFEGGDNTAKGPYGTSLAANRAMADHYDVLLAYKMNGDDLPPDHGYPIRVLIPGCIGGRSVKWLTRIEASANESTNHFHFHDNKVMPTEVRSPEQATEEGWWRRPEYLLYDLNVNSAITTPAHRERIEVLNLQDKYLARGYAYTGGNRRVTRVELSLDSGKSWTLANLEPVPPAEQLAGLYGELVGSAYYKRSRNWTWVRWNFEIEVAELCRADELVIRAWDESQNTQPEKLTWNLMGMMNNPWFRVRLSHDREAQPPTILCDHPTTVSPLEVGGWMERDRIAAAARAVPETPASSLPIYPMSEVEKHASETDCWIVVRGLVYDCTRFLKDHPGGAQSILITAGTDTTEEFDAIHSEKAQDMLKDYLIGQLETTPDQAGSEVKGSTGEVVPTNSPTLPLSVDKLASVPFLNPRQWKKITLESKEALSSTIRLYRFAFEANTLFGLPVGKHVYLKLPQERLYKDMPTKSVMRSYTPSKCGQGFVEFIVKIYYPENGFHPGGAFTQLLDKVRVGETVDVKGPLGEYEYLGNSQYALLHEPKRSAKHIGMIAGGTGITPMWQILSALQNDRDLPYVSLIYCARFQVDLVLADEINEIQARIPDRLKVRYILSQPPSNDWDGGRGRLTLQEVSAHLFPFAGSDTGDSEKVVLLCASDEMIDKSCKPLISDILGPEFVFNNVFVF